MAQITPTPRAGTWLRILGDTSPDGPRAGTWLRVDAVSFGPPPGGWSVGMIQW